MTSAILITICARGGSKGLPTKNVKPLLGRPLIHHSIEIARCWGKGAKIMVSTDSEEIAQSSREAGALTPFLRPAVLATDTAGKLPVLTHALREAEKHFGQKFDVVFDLDPTSPIRTTSDLENAWQRFLETKADVCFSVVKARKNPYFNMVERDAEDRVCLVKKPAGTVLGRQSAPQVWDMNASIYVYRREFLLREPNTLWDGNAEFFEMEPASAFDIDQERDFVIVEALMRWNQSQKGQKSVL